MNNISVFCRFFSKEVSLRSYRAVYVTALFTVMFSQMVFGADAKEKATVRGSVFESLPLTPKIILNRLEKGETFMDMGFIEYETYLRTSIPVSSSIPVHVRRLINSSRQEHTQTDENGKFTFNNFFGICEVSARKMVDVDGETKEAKARCIVRANQNGLALLPLRTDLVTIKGRVLLSDGQPAVGFKITGTPCLGDGIPPELDRLYPEQYSVTASDGTYELSDLRPAEFTTVADYLLHGRATSHGALLEEKISVKEIANISLITLSVPLICEESLFNARRYISILNKKYVITKERSPLVEKPGVFLPKSKGNVIFLPDIILENDKTKKPHP